MESRRAAGPRGVGQWRRSSVLRGPIGCARRATASRPRHRQPVTRLDLRSAVLRRAPGAAHRSVLSAGARRAAARSAVRVDHPLINLQRKDEGYQLAEERIQPDEEAHLQSIIDSFNAQMRRLWIPGQLRARRQHQDARRRCAPSSPCATTCPNTCGAAFSPSREPIKRLGALLGAWAVRHARHRRRRLHEHGHQAHGRAGTQADGRREIHPGPVGHVGADVCVAGHAGQRRSSSSWS